MVIGLYVPRLLPKRMFLRCVKLKIKGLIIFFLNFKFDLNVEFAD